MKLRYDRVLCDYFDKEGDQRGRLSPAIADLEVAILNQTRTEPSRDNS